MFIKTTCISIKFRSCAIFNDLTNSFLLKVLFENFYLKQFVIIVKSLPTLIIDQKFEKILVVPFSRSFLSDTHWRKRQNEGKQIKCVDIYSVR